MTDLEITKLCAEAMGFAVMETVWDSRVQPGKNGFLAYSGNNCLGWYDPLHDDAQAMALMKKFPVEISMGKTKWHVWGFDVDGIFDPIHVVLPDLNRAICECVAKMQQSKCGTNLGKNDE